MVAIAIHGDVFPLQLACHIPFGRVITTGTGYMHLLLNAVLVYGTYRLIKHNTPVECSSMPVLRSIYVAVQCTHSHCCIAGLKFAQVAWSHVTWQPCTIVCNTDKSPSLCQSNRFLAGLC